MKPRLPLKPIGLALLILNLFLNSCTSARMAAVQCPEIQGYRGSKTATGHHSGKNYLTANSKEYNGNSNILNSGRKHRLNSSVHKPVHSGDIHEPRVTVPAGNIDRQDIIRSMTAYAGNLAMVPSEIVDVNSDHSPICAVEPLMIIPALQQACDTIVLRSGSKLIGKVEEIGQYEIKYRRCDYLTGPMISVAKEAVSGINFSNGTSEAYATDNTGIKGYGVRPLDYDSVPKQEGLGMAGFVSGLVGIFIAGIPLGALGVILGLLSLDKIKKYPHKFKGKGMAIASIVIGLVALIGAIVVVLTV